MSEKAANVQRETLKDYCSRPFYEITRKTAHLEAKYKERRGGAELLNVVQYI